MTQQQIFFMGTITDSVLTVDSLIPPVSSSNLLSAGQQIAGSGITPGTTIVGPVDPKATTGGVGTYTLAIETGKIADTSPTSISMVAYSGVTDAKSVLAQAHQQSQWANIWSTIGVIFFVLAGVMIVIVLLRYVLQIVAPELFQAVSEASTTVGKGAASAAAATGRGVASAAKGVASIASAAS